jgi:predicted nucleotidyltransferase
LQTRQTINASQRLAKHVNLVVFGSIIRVGQSCTSHAKHVNLVVFGSVIRVGQSCTSHAKCTQKK